jgi:hypothetical protein
MTSSDFWSSPEPDFAAPKRERRGLAAVVTGLPRSGTSFTAGLIARLGLSPGPGWLLRRANRHNPHGYFEHVLLNRLTGRVLARMGRDFDLNLPGSRAEFEALDLSGFRRAVRCLVKLGGVQVYKDNKLVLYPELYADLYPRARFVFVTREPEARYASRFGKAVTRVQWEAFNEARLALWRASPVSGRALTLRYEDFFTGLDGMIEKVAAHLGLEPDARARASARDFFRPRQGPS